MIGLAKRALGVVCVASTLGLFAGDLARRSVYFDLPPLMVAEVGEGEIRFRRPAEPAAQGVAHLTFSGGECGRGGRGSR